MFQIQNFHLTEADETHCDDIWAWRNSKEVSDWMSNTRFIPYEEHVEWFKHRTAKGFFVYVLSWRHKHIGVISFRDGLSSGKLVPTMYLTAPSESFGLGLTLEWFMLDKAFSFKSCEVVEGIAYKQNPVLSLHKFFGFEVSTESDNLMRVRLNRKKYDSIKDEKRKFIFSN